ncbi:hypothetical protein GIB67_026033 [Kingdonia uniflora]|uniref:GHMP kinase N-terminal domain-containing protein n=1 Tax=Kingdonia uniflora TaxID=39325 RepID=A0A7J7M2V2_9MAGN|nr:hypothetical protein GIB67_026033 [Kingdonia uniflora]
MNNLPKNRCDIGYTNVGCSISEFIDFAREGVVVRSGLGSSAVSAAAAVVAVNEMLDGVLSESKLVLAGLESEAKLRFPMEKELFFVLVNPKFEAPTKKMRAVLPSEIVMLDHISNSSQSGSLGKALSSDRIVDSKLTPLIPGMGAINNAMIGAREFRCTISGVGPTTVAMTDSELWGEKIGEKMVEVFWKERNLKATFTVRSLDRVGARLISSNS